VYSDTKESIETSLESGRNKDDNGSYMQPSTKKVSSSLCSVSTPSVETNSVEHGNNFLWEYKVNGTVHGPFATEDMIQWSEQGYFKGDNIVEVRRINPPSKTNSSSANEESIFEDAGMEENPFVWSNTVDFHLYR